MKILHLVYMFLRIKMVFNLDILITSSSIGQEAAFDVEQNSDKFKVKISVYDDWFYVNTVNIFTF